LYNDWKDNEKSYDPTDHAIQSENKQSHFLVDRDYPLWKSYSDDTLQNIVCNYFSFDKYLLKNFKVE
jgi:hypothetical protein